VVEVSDAEQIPVRPEIHLRPSRVEKVLGVPIGDGEISDILTRLGMVMSEDGEGWRVTAPSSRFDVAIEEDLIEEVGRIYGYERIPAHRGSSGMQMRAEPEVSYDLQRAKQTLVGRGYQEVVTYGFIGPEQLEMIDPDVTGISLANPISTDMSVMRTSLWPGLLQTAQYNLARQQTRLRIFESGLSFRRLESEISQQAMLAGLILGERLPEQWSAEKSLVDFFDLKGDLEAVLALTGSGEGVTFNRSEHPALHPGQSAEVVFRGDAIGWIGMLHPELEAKLDLPSSAYLFEVRLAGLDAGVLPKFDELSKYPSIRRDIAILVDESVTFAAIKRCICQEAPKIIKDIRLFDVYTGENIDSGLKSLALGLILQEKSHTLTDQEVDDVVASVLQGLSRELNAKLRD
jgi:phenylalanyl-tRNA synthetase beta chain